MLLLADLDTLAETLKYCVISPPFLSLREDTSGQQAKVINKHPESVERWENCEQELLLLESVPLDSIELSDIKLFPSHVLSADKVCALEQYAGGQAVAADAAGRSVQSFTVDEACKHLHAI